MEHDEIEYCDKNDKLILQEEDIKIYYSGVDNIITVVDTLNAKWASATRKEAIAAARAILRHFGEDEYDIAYRYRAPTEEEMSKFLTENPNYKPIPKEAYDPDAPLTSEINLGV